MTALDKFARLETTGEWRASPEAPRREVVVAFGKASIVLSDLRGQEILSHWSLPAISRRNPGQMPAVYAPGDEEDGELLELDDQMMIDAIATVQAALARRRPRRGALRTGVIAGVVLAGIGLAAFWLPSLLISHTANVVPFVKAQEIGTNLQGAMQRYTGAACDRDDGLRALERLAERMLPGGGTRLVVLRDGLPRDGVLPLPGRLFLVDHNLVERYEQPEVLAGHLLAADLRASANDPLVETLGRAGIRSTFTLLATGLLPQKSLQAQASAQLRAPQTMPSAEALIARFREAQLTATPFAQSLSADQALARQLTLADPVPPAAAQPLIADADWLALQAVCQR